MIQRIQSIWLLLAALTISFLLFLPIVTTTVGTTEYHLVASGVYQKAGEVNTLKESTTPLLISTIAISIMCLANIFNFKNRKTQKRITMATIALIAGLSFWCSQYATKIPGGIGNASYGVGTFLPLIALVFCLLAIRGINNDEKLIRSADRLR